MGKLYAYIHFFHRKLELLTGNCSKIGWLCSCYQPIASTPTEQIIAPHVLQYYWQNPLKRSKLLLLTFFPRNSLFEEVCARLEWIPHLHPIIRSPSNCEMARCERIKASIYFWMWFTLLYSTNLLIM